MIFAGILAGGTGTRMGNYTIPKQFLLIADRPIIAHVIDKFIVHSGIDKVIVGVNENWHQYMTDIQEKYYREVDKLVIVPGGSDRNGTISAIVEKTKEISGAPEDILVTHDAVRPFVTLKMISENIDAARKYGVCDTVIPATDTIVYSANGEHITDIPLRNNTYQGQTPQSFSVRLFEEVYSSMSGEELQTVTDACKMFMLKGHKVHLVEGSVSNMKITYPYDYKIAQIMMENPEDDLFAV